MDRVRGGALSCTLALVACDIIGNLGGAGEGDVRAILEEQGYSKVTELERDGDSWKFTAKKGDQLCSGTVTVTKSTGSESHSFSSSCKRDTSACKSGAPTECMRIANELYDAEDKVFPTLAAKLYRTACEDDDALACTRAGEFEKIAKKWSKVREYSQKGCDLGNGEGCLRLAFTEDNGDGTDVNKAKALALYKKACEKGVAIGCGNAASELLDGEVGEKDPVGAIELAEKGCKAKHARSCLALGFALHRSKKDPKRAVELFEQGCDAGTDAAFANGCNTGGYILSNGIGVPRDNARAWPLFIKACDKGNAHGCANAAIHLRAGRGVPRDAARATELFAKACTLGLKKHCK